MSVDIFKKQLKEEKFTEIYLFYGQEDFLKEYYLKQLKDKLIDKNFKDFNYYYFEGKNIDLSLLGDAIESLPVMAEKKLIIIKDSGFLKSAKAEEKELLEDILKDVPSYLCIVFYESEIDKRSKLYQLIKKKGLLLEFKYQKPADLISWVGKALKSYNKKMSKEDIYYLLQSCDQGMVSIKNEIDKLVNYTEAREQISKDDIDKVCSKSVESRVFQMIDALMEGKAEDAFESLEEMKILKEPVIKILYLLAKHFGDMLKVKLLINQGATEAKIASEIKIPPFAVKKHIRHVQGISVQNLHIILQECLRLDTDIKTSKINDWIGLETFVAQYALRKI